MQLVFLLGAIGVAQARLALKPTVSPSTSVVQRRRGGDEQVQAGDPRVASAGFGNELPDPFPSQDDSNASQDSVQENDEKTAEQSRAEDLLVQDAMKAVEERQWLDNHRRVYGTDADDERRSAVRVRRWNDPNLSLDDKKKVASRANEHTMTITFCQVMTVASLVLFATRPQYFWILQLMVFPAVMAIKYPMYRPLKYHLFFFDFCYWMNAWFMVVLLADHVFGYSDIRLLKTMFWSALGPIAHALWLWRNSLVMHDKDKVTSTALHIFPMLTCVAEKFHGSSYQVSSQTGFWPSDFMHGWIFYAVWQVLYTIIMDGVLRRKLKEDPDMVNSIRWLLRDQNGMAFKSVSMVGNYIGIRGITGNNKRGKFSFAVAFSIYTFLCTLPIPFLWWSETSTHVMAALLFAIVVYNGATFSTKTYKDNELWKDLKLDSISNKRDPSFDSSEGRALSRSSMSHESLGTDDGDEDGSFYRERSEVVALGDGESVYQHTERGHRDDSFSPHGGESVVRQRFVATRQSGRHPKDGSNIIRRAQDQHSEHGGAGSGSSFGEVEGGSNRRQDRQPPPHKPSVAAVNSATCGTGFKKCVVS